MSPPRRSLGVTSITSHSTRIVSSASSAAGSGPELKPDHRCVPRVVRRRQAEQQRRRVRPARNRSGITSRRCEFRIAMYRIRIACGARELRHGCWGQRHNLRETLVSKRLHGGSINDPTSVCPCPPAYLISTADTVFHRLAAWTQTRAVALPGGHRCPGARPGGRSWELARRWRPSEGQTRKSLAGSDQVAKTSAGMTRRTPGVARFGRWLGRATAPSLFYFRQIA